MKKEIITVNLTANVETEIDVVGGSNAIIKNRGDDVVYVSRYPNITADGDNVKVIDGGSADILRNIANHEIRNNVADYYGTIYALSSSGGKVQVETTNSVNFRQIVKGGDGGMDSIVGSKNFICLADNNIDTYFGTYEEVV